MRVALRVFHCILTYAAYSSALLAAPPKYDVKVDTARADAIYHVGETVVFDVRVFADGQPVTTGKIDYVLDHDGVRPIERETRALGGQALEIRCVPGAAGFVRCLATFTPPEGKKVQAVAGAAVSPREIRPSLPPPPDFDEFWEEQKRLLASSKMAVTMTPVEPDADDIERFDVRVSCLGGAPVSGYYARPKQATPRGYPAVLWVHGAGVRSSYLGNAVRGAREGFLSFDINAHGIDNGEPEEFYADLSSGRLNKYQYQGRQDRDTCYFRGMCLRLVRAVDFLTSQPEWDGKTLAVFGSSQGGAQAIIAGGLDPRVTFVAAGVPAMCDHTGMVVHRISGWPKLVPVGADGIPDPTVLEASRYYDAVNFARNCHVPAIVSVGFVDPVCPPTSCYAAFNQLQGPVTILPKPHMAHETPDDIRNAFWEAVVQHSHR